MRSVLAAFMLLVGSAPASFAQESAPLELASAQPLPMGYEPQRTANLALPAPAAPHNSGTAPQPLVPSPETIDPPAPAQFYFVDTGHCRQYDGGHCSKRSGSCRPYCPVSVMRFDHDCRYRPTSIDEMVASLDPSAPLCILVHGAFVNHQWAVETAPMHCARIKQAGRGRPLNFIAFHWPSESSLLPLPALEVARLGRRADSNGYYLAQFLQCIPPEMPVCLVAHSHGLRLSLSCLRALAQGRVADPVSPVTGQRRRIRLVSAAGTMDQHWANPGQRYHAALCRMECWLNCYHPCDPVLRLYPLNDLLLHHSVGSDGFRSRDLRKIGRQARKIREFDVSPYVGFGHEIEVYHRPWTVRSRMAPYIYFD